MSGGTGLVTPSLGKIRGSVGGVHFGRAHSGQMMGIAQISRMKIRVRIVTASSLAFREARMTRVDWKFALLASGLLGLSSLGGRYLTAWIFSHPNGTPYTPDTFDVMLAGFWGFLLARMWR